MDMSMTTLIVLSLACFRLTHLLISDVITAPIRWIFVEEVEEPDAQGRMNKYVYPKMPAWKAIFGILFSCPWCMGVWVGAALTAGWYYYPSITFAISLIFAISAVAGLLETVTRYWAVHTYSPTQTQLNKFDEIKQQFMDSKNKSA
ncbi:DUF1360 domain-containing protein [Brevibacillus composti]|uniref:DUF1360 domain-containing protein n=1 Tax=Brevibacillus composti TaxID=2796470 RepID=A0A7T5EHM8_9BACL|nr:DUF1360 domain-containing protein [Brevibacillus composti]QQE72799.1 DUF1360 domain-containing protein [Brevibacillus composti]QUO39877.1 DUF1360 domain-containing protein [Brevibacillus composti]